MDSSSKGISFVTVVKNEPCQLRKTLYSVSNLIKSDVKFEIIIIDGSDNKECQKIVKNFSDLQITYIFERDSGIYNAFNKGLKHASYARFMWLNAGDLLHPEFLKEINLSLDKADESSIIVGEMILVDRGKVINRRKLSKQKDFIKNVGFSNTSAVYPLWLVKEAGYYDESFKIAGDAHLILKLFRDYAVRAIRSEFKVYMASGGISQTKTYETRVEYEEALIMNFGNSYLSSKKFQVMLERLKNLNFLRKLKLFRKLRKFASTIKQIYIYFSRLIINIVPFRTVKNSLLRFLFNFEIKQNVSFGQIEKIYNLGKFRVDENTIFGDRLIIDNRGEIQIGKNVNIGPFCAIYTRGHDVLSPYFETKTSAVRLEDYSVLLSYNKCMPGTILRKGAVAKPGEILRGSYEAYTVFSKIQRPKLLLYSPSRKKSKVD